LDFGEGDALDEAGNEEEEEDELEGQLVEVAAAGDVGPCGTETGHFDELEDGEDGHGGCGVTVEHGHAHDHQELFVVGEQVVVVGPEEMLRRPFFLLYS
jgi:hypothetical protein